ncbi:MAG: hypothetical protein IJZ55_12220 [Lachnospiraceae bacterium]|nr:hypothetical protein [Lachnospiraceae bacterium]
MTSRSSFFKLLKEDLRQRLWTIVLAAIVFLLPVPIYIAMEISGSRGFSTGMLDNFARRLASPMGANSVWMVLVTVTGALICAVSGFGYLFSKKKVDFFHALPVKRETLFAVKYVNGVLIYLVPYVAMVLVSFVIIAVTGNFRAVVLTVAAKGLAVHLLGYLTVYTTLILCVTFVGNIVVFFAVSGWTFGITVVALWMYCLLEEMFFDTYSYLGDAFTERLHFLRFLCPGYFYVAAVDDATVSMLIQQLLFTLVLAGITVFVYRMRPSDGAGKAIAFPVLKPVIRVSIEILAGGLMGMMFYDMADNSHGVPGWMIFGAVLGVVLSHMLVQSIFHFDIRKCFASKGSMFACVIVSIAVVLVMRYDTFGYDTYLPKEKKIESVAIEVPNLDARRNNSRHNGTTMEWFSEVAEMELTNISEIYPALKVMIEDSEVFYDAREYGEYREGYVSVNVAYRLKNGKTVYREYRMEGMPETVFAPVFENPEYKEIHYADIYTVPEKLVDSVTVRHAMNEQVMSLNETEKTELMSVLRRELSALTLKEKLENLPVAILDLRIVHKMSAGEGQKSDGVYDVYDYTSELPIYASFTETLRFLTERGFVIDKAYEWTGREMMRIEFPYGEYRGKDGNLIWSAYTEKYSFDSEIEYYVTDSSEETDYVLLNEKAVQTVAVEDWAYGDHVIPVEPEDFERLYALCTWDDLKDYGDPSENTDYDFRVFLEVPQDGYNMYETYRYVVPYGTDLSFLFD